MQRKVIFVIILFCNVFLCTCCNVNTENKNDEATNQEQIASGEHFSIYREHLTEVTYEIYDRKGEIILKETTECPLKIEMLDDEILNLCIGRGSGIIENRYYNTKKNIWSEKFFDVVAYNDEMIAYIEKPQKKSFEERILVVQNVFDKSFYYKEFALDFSSDLMPVEKCYFLKDNKALCVVYYPRDEASEKEIYLEL